MNQILCKCGKFMKCEKTGVTVRLNPYIGYFKADLFKCPTCNNEVMTGFSKEIIDDRYNNIDYDFN